MSKNRFLPLFYLHARIQDIEYLYINKNTVFFGKSGKSGIFMIFGEKWSKNNYESKK